MNYDLCVQKATEAQSAVEAAQRTHKDAIKRFEVAEIALSSAVMAYQISIATDMATAAILNEKTNAMESNSDDNTGDVEVTELQDVTNELPLAAQILD